MIYHVGGPRTLQLKYRPVPESADPEVLIRVRVIRLNQSELFTRQGLSPNVALFRTRGIEAVGEVAAASGRELPNSDTVATVISRVGAKVRRRLRGVNRSEDFRNIGCLRPETVN